MKIIGKRRKYALWDTFPSSVDIMMVDRESHAGAFSRKSLRKKIFKTTFSEHVHLCWLHVLCVDQLDDGAKLFKLWGFLGEALILLYKVGISLQGVDDGGASSSSQDRPCSKCSSENKDVTVSLTDVTLCVTDVTLCVKDVTLCVTDVTLCVTDVTLCVTDVTVSTKLGNICISNFPTCFQAQGCRRPCTCAHGCSLGETCQ